jgi:rSAM/selenodomain-associated transferase 2
MVPTVIIPTLNEAVALPATLARVRAVWPTAKIIVSDGGSADATTTLARAAGATVVTGPPSRGQQLRTGAAAATAGSWWLFLHADTLLPPDAAAVVARFVAIPGATVATFRLRFDQPRFFLRLCAWFTRFDTVWTRFGDQGILISREAYATLGGFPAWPLFEDVALLRAARRLRPVFSLPSAVTTSARRFARHGHLRQQLRNALLLRRFLAGESPHRLAALYAPPHPPSQHHESTLV